MPRFKTTLVASVLALGALVSAKEGNATPLPACLASPQCTLDNQTFTTNPTAGIPNGGGLTFIVAFTTPNQSPSSIGALVEDYLALLGVTGETFIGRAGNSSTFASGISNLTTTPVSNNNDTAGTFSFNAGGAGLKGGFVAIHAGNGQTDDLFLINTPGTSGTWATNNGHDLSNFDLFSTGSCSGPNCPGVQLLSVPEPMSLTLLGTGLLGLGVAVRRRRN
jgi:hypothetical protein